jgi:integrase
MSQREIQDLFRVIKSPRDRAIFRLAYHHGLRAHEIGKLEVSSFRERDGLLFIYRGKGSISRQHSLIDVEINALKAYIRECGPFVGPLFPSRNHRPITRQRLDQLIKQYGQLAGIRPEACHMHALKHSCGTHLAERGSSAQEIQDWLGHRDSRSTDIYMHFSPQRRKAAFEKNREWR